MLKVTHIKDYIIYRQNILIPITSNQKCFDIKLYLLKKEIPLIYLFKFI